MQIINRISKVLAILIVYIICAYGYLTTKGFIFKDGTPMLSNQALAKEEFSVKINGDLILSQKSTFFSSVDFTEADTFILR